MRENRHSACMTRETMERVGGSRAVTCAYRKLPSGKMKSISIKSPQSSSPILAQHLRPRSNTAWMKPRLKTCKPLDPHLPSLRDRPLLSQRERRLGERPSIPLPQCGRGGAHGRRSGEVRDLAKHRLPIRQLDRARPNRLPAASLFRPGLAGGREMRQTPLRPEGV